MSRSAAARWYQALHHHHLLLLCLLFGGVVLSEVAALKIESVLCVGAGRAGEGEVGEGVGEGVGGNGGMGGRERRVVCGVLLLSSS